MTKTTTNITDHVVTCLRAGDYVGLAEHFASDALLDMNLPTWRFQLQGRAAITEYFAKQTGGLANLHCTQSRDLVTDDAVAVESECRFDGPDGEYLWRCVDLVRIVAGEIVEHAQYCTGCWSPADIARQADEAPMVRW
jgi:ketosteroid isomerase-like protein